MKILITQRELVRMGGTEMFTVDVSKALAKRGHEVAIYTRDVVGIGEHVYADGVKVYTQLRDLPWVPDLIHGQHHLPTITALTHFPTCPAIYYCHGSKPWAERPPIHPRIHRYVMMCQSMVLKSKAMFQLPLPLVSYLPNFVNTQRFSVAKSPPERPSRALLYSQGGFSAQEIENLKDACKQLNLELDFIGYPYNNPQPRPELFLQDYDLVFAIGRSAYEALACGCAVIPITPTLPGELITPKNLERYIFSNLSVPQFSSSERMSPAWLAKQLESYHADEVMAVTTHVRNHCTLDACIDQLESIYQAVLAEERVEATPTETAQYLQTLWPAVDSIWIENSRLRKELSNFKSTQDLADKLRLDLKSTQALADKLRLDLTSSKKHLEQSYLDLEHHYQLMTSKYEAATRELTELKLASRDLAHQAKLNQRVWHQVEGSLKRKILGLYFWRKIQKIRQKLSPNHAAEKS